jgi:hypothetical protein
VRHARGSGWRSTRWSRISLSLAACAAFAALFASCDGPQAPTSGTPDDLGGRFESGKLTFQLSGATGATTALALVASNLSFDPTTHELRVDVAIRNDGSDTAVGPDRILVYGFVPQNVEPLNASCGPADDELAVPHCSFDHHGTYGDDGGLAAGEVSAPVTWILRVPSGESFAFRARLGSETAAPGTISGRVFVDRDGDGHRDAADHGAPGIVVHLRAGNEVTDATTDANGSYAFLVQAPGLYEVSVEPPPGVPVTTPAALQVTILERQDGTLSSFSHADFGLAAIPEGPEVRIEGWVYDDANHNGERDAGEAGIANVRVEAKATGVRDDDDEEDDDKAGDAIAAPGGRAAEAVQEGPHPANANGGEARTRTDADGHYTLAVRGPGPWTVKAESIDGFDRTTPKTLTFLEPPAAGESLHANFGYAHEDAASRAEIRGVVFLDLDRDGVRDLGEPGIRAVRLTAAGTCTLPSQASDDTDDRGRYELEGGDVNCPLPWTLTRSVLPGTIATTPATVEITAPPAVGHDYVIDFGVALDEPGTAPAYVVEGTVFLDVDRSGRREIGEPGVPNAQVLLLGPCDTLRAVTTDAEGHYRFESDTVGRCPVTAVWQSLPHFDKHTTPNPVRVDPQGPAGGSQTIDFGVRY